MNDMILLEGINGVKVIFSRNNIPAICIIPNEPTNIIINQYKLEYESTEKRNEVFMNIFKGR